MQYLINRSFKSTSLRSFQGISRSFCSSRIIFNASEDKSSQIKPEIEKTNEQQTQPTEHDKSSISHSHKRGVINAPIQNALLGLGFQKFTPVQTKSIEPILSTDKDLIVKAKTGTGKTLAFGIPLIEQALKSPTNLKGVVSLVIAPTRDLAFQIRDELNKVIRHKEVVNHHKNKVFVQTAVGGENRWQQMKAFQNRHPAPSIVVATPGRFLDLINEPDVRQSFKGLNTLVLDEADRLLGDGFKEDLVEISDILKELTGKELKTLLFSATLDKSIVQFSKQILREDVEHIDTVDPNEPETHEKITQSLILTNNFFESIVSAILFIESEAKNDRHFKAIVFLPTIKAVTYFYDILSTELREKKIGLPSHQLHGQLSQSTRDRSVRNFRKGFSGVLVASDVGARGMDFPNVTNVIQIGLPMDSTNYVHRVGRTARGGNTGKAVMILSKAESRFIRVLKNRNVTIADQFEYEAAPKAEENISEVSLRARHKYSLDLVIESLAGFSKGVLSSYRLNLFEILEDLRDAYARFQNDPEKKPRTSPNFVSKVLGLSRRDGQEIFDTSRSEDGNDRDNKFGNDDYDDTYIKKPRSGYGSRNNRGNDGFRRNDRTDRPPRNDRNDRNDGFRRNNRNDRENRSFSGSRDNSRGSKRRFD
ncbi:hypothetical protein WICMUC_005860 [Wickerhamomyces mucosus]|uniref:ATP-dependent RNA helicase n=1 Tax=Wickerhamomyces mucosus TaxID=1378264 RepID=A0A9P8T3L1_9ASCO|nr:hypothetical protein WICMUC_005860 [Wickerhamomyces mucosus]